MKNNKGLFLGLIISCALILRIIPLGFPNITADEARIASRGYALKTFGTDELGRRYPLIFNSSEDYQLSITSYITAGGIILFGKSDLGVRFPFIILGVLVVWLSYLVAFVFNPEHKFRLIVALITAFSPVLIFLSKAPNEIILLICLLLLLFYLLTKRNINFILSLIVIILLIFVSKIAWFILTPFIIFTLFFYQNTQSNKKKLIIILSLVITFLAFSLFLRIPQSTRSLSENNLSLFSNITTKNGIDKLRGQGIDSNWPPIVEKLLFNKTHFIFVGFLNWLSNLQPSIFFSQFDKTGVFGFVNLGAWSKILIIPFLFSIVNLLIRGDKKLLFLLGYFLVLTFPILFIYPKESPNIVATVLPFMAILIASGLIKLNKIVTPTIIVIMIFEVFVNLIYLNSEIKNTNYSRPGWIKSILIDGYQESKRNQVAFSDDIALDVASFLQWYTPTLPSADYSQIDYPYKFHQYKLPNIRLIGYDNSFYNCGLEKPVIIFASIRDLNKIQKDFKVNINKTYKDSLGNDVVYTLEPKICIK